MEETKLGDAKSHEECAYYYLMGIATSTLSNDKFLDRYGLAGPGQTMVQRKKAAMVNNRNQILQSSEWPKFKKHVNSIYQAKIQELLKKKKNKTITKTMVKAARKEVAKQIKPGLLVEYFVPTEHGSHFFALRKDGLLANGYPDPVFSSAKTDKGVGIGLGFQRDYSHGLCQTFAIMWLLISEERTRNVDVMYFKPITKTAWNKLCAEWHKRIWVNMLPSGHDSMIYLYNAELALQFLSEFTEYCDWSWPVEELVEQLSTVYVQGCPTFDRRFMTNLLESIKETDGDFKGQVTLSRIFQYLNREDQKNRYMALWFDEC